MTRLLIGIWAMAGLALVACVPNEMPEASDGRALYMEYCSACHGENAKGDGPMARAMTTAPKDLTLISLRHGDSFPRAKVLSTIDGYARSDLDGPGMPEFGELLQGDLVPLDTGARQTGSDPQASGLP